MCERVAVDCLVFSSGNAEVRLTVAVQVKGAQGNPAVDGLLMDGRSYASAPPSYFTGKPGIESHDLHRLHPATAWEMGTSILLGCRHGVSLRYLTAFVTPQDQCGVRLEPYLPGR
jgi:hypothetical protein